MLDSIDARRRELRFARRLYPARIAGAGLGFWCVAAVFSQRDVPLWAWVALVFHGYLWPHLAWWLARRSDTPHRTEIRNLLVDSLLGGLWVALMAFNALSSVVVLAMLSVDNMAIGGWKLLAKAALVQLAGVGIAVVLVGVQLAPAPTPLVVYACLPMIAFYPLMAAAITFSFSQRLARQKQQWRALSHTDGLTGLPNRRYWEEAVIAQFEQYKRNGRCAALVMADIDHFKAVNDHFGHACGDEVIREVAACIAGHMRRVDVAGRYGGEEFALLLPDTDEAGAWQLAERLRNAVAQSDFAAQPGTRCTLSLGIAMITAARADYRDWIEAADAAMYQAKREGRNRSVVAGGDDGGEAAVLLGAMRAGPVAESLYLQRCSRVAGRP